MTQSCSGEQKQDLVQTFGIGYYSDLLQEKFVEVCRQNKKVKQNGGVEVYIILVSVTITQLFLRKYNRTTL